MNEPINVTALLVQWLPMLLVIAVWVGITAFAMRRGRGVYTGQSGKTHGQMLEESVEESKRMNNLLEKMLVDHEDRLIRLEQGAMLPSLRS
jgi:hypothetical protein